MGILAVSEDQAVCPASPCSELNGGCQDICTEDENTGNLTNTASQTVIRFSVLDFFHLREALFDTPQDWLSVGARKEDSCCPAASGAPTAPPRSARTRATSSAAPGRPAYPTS